MEKHNSDYWSNLMDFRVLDPDGWDRKNFSASWAEEITQEEFFRRAMASTIISKPGTDNDDSDA